MVSVFEVDVLVSIGQLVVRLVHLSASFTSLLDMSLSDSIHLLLYVFHDLQLSLPLLLNSPQQIIVNQACSTGKTQTRVYSFNV